MIRSALSSLTAPKRLLLATTLLTSMALGGAITAPSAHAGWGPGPLPPQVGIFGYGNVIEVLGQHFTPGGRVSFDIYGRHPNGTWQYLDGSIVTAYTGSGIFADAGNIGYYTNNIADACSDPTNAYTELYIEAWDESSNQLVDAYGTAGCPPPPPN